ncbi:MAG: DUF455 family protein [Leptospiraceae bacterium]|nr:DUF455 family protein [Leptospiraceae bacterium]
MNTINEYCLHILKSDKLSEKILQPPLELKDISKEFVIPEKPAREDKIRFSEKKSKIPRLEHLNQKLNRGVAIHHFANHELLAIELFAYALLKFQDIDESYRRDLFASLQEEQKHLKLYLNRMNELGIEFGEKPLNYIFWKYLPLMQTFEKFSAIMSLSFEGANLDYAVIYKKTFERYDDKTSADIMEIVYRDELKHVKRGMKILKNRDDKSISEWEYYNSLLTHPFTPRRAKGYFYLPYTRKKVGFSDEFIQKLGDYKDEFSNRKKEIIPAELEDWGIYTG